MACHFSAKCEQLKFLYLPNNYIAAARHDYCSLFLGDNSESPNEMCLTLKKVHYFSDGTASQNKNCKILSNLAFHEDALTWRQNGTFSQQDVAKMPMMVSTEEVKREAVKTNLEAITTDHNSNGLVPVGCAEHK